MIHIWNMALGFVGTRTVAAENENTQEAIQCRLYWNNARRQVLRDYPWHFARRRARLAQMPVPEGWEGAYAHAFSLPTDCLKVLGLISHNNGGSPQPYSLALDGATMSQVLLANLGQPILIYTADVRQVELFDDLFSHLLARRLAALIVVPLLRTVGNKARELEELYRSALPQAREASASEVPTKYERDVWFESRFETILP